MLLLKPENKFLKRGQWPRFIFAPSVLVAQLYWPSALSAVLRNVLIRSASLSDVPFLAHAIRTAEAGPGGVAPYEALFGLSPQECTAALAAMLEEELEGCELCPDAFLIAHTADGTPVATCAAWVECADDNQPSNLLKAQLLSHTLGAARFRAAEPELRILATVGIARTVGALQLESFYTHPSHRGQGLAARLIEAQRQRFPEATVAEIQLTTANAAAQAAYARAGFAVGHTQTSPHPELPRLLGADGKVLMRRVIAA